MAKKINTDIIIIGGGLNGIAAACLLAGKGLNTTLLEANHVQSIIDKNSDGRCSAIAYGSLEIFKQLNIWDNLASQSGEILDIRVSDGNSSSFLHYSHELVGNSPMGYMVENHKMLKSLYEKAKSYQNLQLLDNMSYHDISLESDQAVVTLANNRQIAARLIIAADGKYSKLRTKADIQTSHKDYMQKGIVCTLWHEQNHQCLAQERFLPSGPFAMLPMFGGHHSSIVWVEKPNLASHYLAMDDDQFVEHIKMKSGDYLGEIKLASKRFSYDLTLSHAKSYIGQRIALIGDAAHGIHPLAGQGFNLGIRGILKLSNILEQHKNLGLDIGTHTTLEEYNKIQKIDALSLAIITDQLNHIFSINHPIARIPRRIGLKLVNSSPPLKKFFMKHAMGLGLTAT